ncbi:hypothetical protein GCM10023183_14780 [Nibribacter koreensis]|uniref:Uncharacterized protein n=1 Tax=Nibribacter koreensis TaxID=1084519 RepID=A0ABP8FGI0_9BACT
MALEWVMKKAMNFMLSSTKASPNISAINLIGEEDEGVAIESVGQAIPTYQTNAGKWGYKSTLIFSNP